MCKKYEGILGIVIPKFAVLLAAAVPISAKRNSGGGYPLPVGARAYPGLLKRTVREMISKLQEIAPEMNSRYNSAMQKEGFQVTANALMG